MIAQVSCQVGLYHHCNSNELVTTALVILTVKITRAVVTKPV